MRLSPTLLLVTLLSGHALAAPPSKNDARSYYNSGTAHYNLSEFSEALTDYKEAYRLRPDPVFLFNIAQCYRRLGDAAQAGGFYRNYLREAKTAPNRVEVERLITEMDAQVEKAKEAERAKAAAAAEAERARLAEVEAAQRPTGGTVLVAAPAKKPLVKRAWFWGAVGGGAAVVVAAVTLGVVLGVQRNPQPGLGTVEVK